MAVDENLVESDFDEFSDDAFDEQKNELAFQQELVKRSLPLHERVLNDLCTDEELDCLLEPLRGLLGGLEGMQGFEWCLDYIDTIRKTDSCFVFKKTLFITLLGIMPELQAHVCSYTPKLVNDIYANMFFPELRVIVDMYNNTQLKPAEVLARTRTLCARATAYRNVVARMKEHTRHAQALTQARPRKRRRKNNKHQEERGQKEQKRQRMDG